MTDGAICDMLYCGKPVVGTLEFRPPGHALHEGTILYLVCADHLAAHADEPGYRQVRWENGRYVRCDYRPTVIPNYGIACWPTSG